MFNWLNKMMPTPKTMTVKVGETYYVEYGLIVRHFRVKKIYDRCIIFECKDEDGKWWGNFDIEPKRFYQQIRSEADCYGHNELTFEVE